MQEESGNISIIYPPHRELGAEFEETVSPLERENLETFHPSREHRALAWEARQGFLPNSQHKHLPAHSWKLQRSKLRAQGQTALCGQHLPAPLSCCCCPGGGTQGLHRGSSPGHSPISQQGGDKGIPALSCIKIYRSKETVREKRKKKTCFLTSCKLRKRKKNRGLDRQQFTA